ncbi:MAG: P27 family phage terminase small subunit [Solirubrobacterales bacterium]|nr:P27 family phage terminase small subunit [Solirubrobacterales bacterium]
MEAPGHLAREGKRFWTDIAAEYGVDFEPFEWQLLRLAAEALDRGAQARRAIRRHGLTYESPQGSPVARPEVAIEKTARAAFAQLVRQLGLGEIEEEQPEEPHEPRQRRGRSYTSTIRRRNGEYRAAKAPLAEGDDDE